MDLAKGEIGVVLAPTGVGKSTLLTKIANHSFNLGYNVLQIFFEDNPKLFKENTLLVDQSIAPDELTLKKEEVMEKVKSIKDSMDRINWFYEKTTFRYCNNVTN